MRYRPIRRNSEFGRVYARGKSYVNPALVLYVLKTRGRNTRSQYRRLRSDLRGPGHDPQTEKLAAEQRCGKAVCPGRSAG